MTTTTFFFNTYLLPCPVKTGHGPGDRVKFLFPNLQPSFLSIRGTPGDDRNDLKTGPCLFWIFVSSRFFVAEDLAISQSVEILGIKR